MLDFWVYQDEQANGIHLNPTDNKIQLSILNYNSVDLRIV